MARTPLRTSSRRSTQTAPKTETQAEEAVFLPLGALFELEDGQQIRLDTEWNSIFNVSDDMEVSIFAKDKISKRDKEYKSLFLCVKPIGENS